jgi:hypothetical protein
VNATVCAHANYRPGRCYGGTKLERYAHDDCHEEYWKHLGIRMEQKSVEWHVVVDGQCYLHVLMKSCSEENEWANGGKKPQVDCQWTHCVDLSPRPNSFLGHHRDYERDAGGDAGGDLDEYEGQDLLLPFVGRDQHWCWGERDNLCVVVDHLRGDGDWHGQGVVVLRDRLLA